MTQHPAPLSSARTSRVLLATFAGISAVGALAACSSTPSGTSDGGNSTTSGSGTTTTATSSNYKDGTYTEPGSYVSPGGKEHISVTMTLAKNVVTAVKVTTVQADPTAQGYEHLFEGGISAAAVGKNINTLNIGVVAGSSLTSMGFNQALAKIKADAKE